VSTFANREPFVLGISASHNGAACLLHGPEIVAAIQEERLSRRKRDRVYGSTGSLCIRYCLDAAGITPEELDLVVVCTTGPQSARIHDPLRSPVLRDLATRSKVHLISHHLGHALSAFALSGFDDAIILVVDGLGSPAQDLNLSERKMAPSGMSNPHEIISIYHGHGQKLEPIFKQFVEDGRWVWSKGFGLPYFSSLGGMYAAAAHQIFGHVMEAGKVMGLAPMAEPGFPPEAFWNWEKGQLIFLRNVPDCIRMNLRWPQRASEHGALAAAVQRALEEALILLCREPVKILSSQNLY
jgi:carbamoyltransferase